MRRIQRVILSVSLLVTLVLGLTIDRSELAAASDIGVTGRVSCDGKGNVGLAMDIRGKIDASTVAGVKKLFVQYHEAVASGGSDKCERTRGNDLSAYGTHFEVSSRGGSVAAAMVIGRIFRKENVELMVDRVCMSSCVLVLAGAVDRQIRDSDSVGIHRPYFATSPQKPLDVDQVKRSYGRMLNEMRAYLSEMDVSEQLANDMLAIEPEDVRILTRAELKRYRLEGPTPAERQRLAIEREADDVQKASKLGIDRLEYNRRKTLARSCIYTTADEVETNQSAFFACKEHILKTGRRN